MSSISRIAVVTCALLIFLPFFVGCGGGSSSDNRERVVFDSNRDGNDEIYIMRTDGRGLTRLTNDPASDLTAAISPDGATIVFASNRHNNIHYEIYIMNTRGGDITRLTHFENRVSSFPSFSPDGSKIVFQQGSDIYIMSSIGGAVTNLTNSATGQNSYPLFSPDGSKIIFSSNRSGSFDIYTMNLSGGDLERLTNDSGQNMMPAYSPDGSKIAFARHDQAWDGIYVMNSDGSEWKKLIDGWNAHPCFSPDGSGIAFAKYAEDESAEIYVMSAGGGTPKRLTHSPGGTSSSRPFFGIISY